MVSALWYISSCERYLYIQKRGNQIADLSDKKCQAIVLLAVDRTLSAPEKRAKQHQARQVVR